MLFPLSSLKTDVTKRVNLWERQVVTNTETVSWLLDRFAFAVHDFPDSHPAVAEVLAAVPARLIAGMAKRLADCRRTGGGWHWPPAGKGLPTPGPTGPWQAAGPAEAAALDILDNWVAELVASGCFQRLRQEAEPPSGPATFNQNEHP
jgi:hypothetical protein